MKEKKYKLGDVIELHYGRALTTSNRIPGNIPVYSSAGITGSHNVPLYSSPSIIVGRKGTVGSVFYNDRPFFCIDTAYYILPNDDIYDLKFLYYLLQTLGLDRLNEDSAVPGLNRGTAYKQEISLPPLPTQSRIASILSAFDDKIENNRRMNQTLEQMALALFNHYFVDNIDRDNLPEGWRMGKIEDLFILQRGFDLPASKRVHGRFEVIAAGGSNGYHETAMVKGPGITTGRSGVIGNVFYILEDFWPLNTSLYIKELKRSTPLHAFFVLKQLDLKSLNGGSAVPTLNRNHVHSLETIIPPKEKIIAFEREVKPLFVLKRKNEEQSETLLKIRDTLLPKLMSGEIDVDTLMKEEALSKELVTENLKTA